MTDNTGVGIGPGMLACLEYDYTPDNRPGPIRHPRPLTAAELHLELEKEQESIVQLFLRLFGFRIKFNG